MTNLEKWRFYLQDYESPDIFLDWTLYWTVASALQRRVWYMNGTEPIYPNLYVVNVAKPGIGKSRAARLAGNKILKTFTYIDPKIMIGGSPAIIQTIPFSAENSSVPSLIRQIAQSTRSFTTTGPDGKQISYCHSSLCMLLSEEMTSIFSRTNESVSDFLNHCYDGEDYEYRMKDSTKCDIIKRPCINLLGCTTPERLAELMRAKILQQGFTARAIFLYAEKPRKLKALVEVTEEQQNAFNEVVQHIKALTKITGQCYLSDEAKKFFIEQYETGKLTGNRVNQHHILDDYYGRKKIHVFKLAIVLHFLDSLNNIIEKHDIINAIKTLEFAETDMHRALGAVGKNPLNEVAENVLEAMRKNGGRLSNAQLCLLTYKDANDLQRKDIIQFLINSQQITVVRGQDGKDYYQLKG